MRHLLILWAFLLPALSQAQLVKIPPRKAVPREVLKSAQMATQGLADRVVRGDFQVVLDKMFPEFKKKEARKAGGMVRFEKKMLKSFQKLQGDVRLAAMQALEPYSAFEVNFGIESRTVDGKQTKAGVYRDWLVFVPTQSVIFATDTGVNPPEIVKIKSEGFQIAICKKGTNNWAFMDGSQVKAFQLRKFFPYLPADDKQLALPPVRAKTIPKN